MSDDNIRKSALDTIADLASAHNITADEIAARLSMERTPENKSSILGRLFNYLGGIFIFSGICILIGIIWPDIGSAQRVIITFGTGLVAFIIGGLSLRDARFEKASTPFFLVSALLQPTGLFVFLNEYVPRTGDATIAVMAVFGIMCTQQALAFWGLRRSSLLFFAIFFWSAFIGITMDWINFDAELTGIALGISLICLSFMAGKSKHRAITPFWYFVGGLPLLGSWWALFEDSVLDLTYLGVNAFLIYLSIIASSRSLLFVSVLGLLFYMSYFAFEYFADVIGWPICLIALGFAMIGLSAYALKLGKKIGQRAPS